MLKTKIKWDILIQAVFRERETKANKRIRWKNWKRLFLGKGRGEVLLSDSTHTYDSDFFFNRKEKMKVEGKEKKKRKEERKEREVTSASGWEWRLGRVREGGGRPETSINPPSIPTRQIQNVQGCFGGESGWEVRDGGLLDSVKWEIGIWVGEKEANGRGQLRLWTRLSLIQHLGAVNI